jgi:hypothetical protein
LRSDGQVPRRRFQAARRSTGSEARQAIGPIVRSGTISPVEFPRSDGPALAPGEIAIRGALLEEFGIPCEERDLWSPTRSSVSVLRMNSGRSANHDLTIMAISFRPSGPATSHRSASSIEHGAATAGLALRKAAGPNKQPAGQNWAARFAWPHYPRPRVVGANDSERPTRAAYSTIFSSRGNSRSTSLTPQSIAGLNRYFSELECGRRYIAEKVPVRCPRAHPPARQRV